MNPKLLLLAFILFIGSVSAADLYNMSFEDGASYWYAKGDQGVAYAPTGWFLECSSHTLYSGCGAQNSSSTWGIAGYNSVYSYAQRSYAGQVTYITKSFSNLSGYNLTFYHYFQTDGGTAARYGYVNFTDNLGNPLQGTIIENITPVNSSPYKIGWLQQKVVIPTNAFNVTFYYMSTDGGSGSQMMIDVINISGSAPFSQSCSSDGNWKKSPYDVFLNASSSSGVAYMTHWYPSSTGTPSNNTVFTANLEGNISISYFTQATSGAVLANSTCYAAIDTGIPVTTSNASSNWNMSNKVVAVNGTDSTSSLAFTTCWLNGGAPSNNTVLLMPLGNNTLICQSWDSAGNAESNKTFYAPYFNQTNYLSGSILRSNGTAVSNANVSINDSLSQYYVTNSTGIYNFSIMFIGTRPINISATEIGNVATNSTGVNMSLSDISKNLTLNLVRPFEDCLTMVNNGIAISSAYNFSFYDENAYLSYNTKVNTSVQANFNLSISGNSFAYYLAYENVTGICLGYSNSSTAVNLSTTIFYSGTSGSNNGSNYPQRQYYLLNASTVGNSSINLLLQNNYYFVEFDVKQPDLFPATGIYLQILKYFTQNDTYVLVAECQTDSFGICVIPLDVPSPIYRMVILAPNMTTILDTKTRMQIPLSACTGTNCQKEVILSSNPSEYNPFPLIGQFDVMCNVTDNGVTNVSFCNFTSITGMQDTFNYSVINQSSNAFVCSTSVHSASGVFTCNLGSIGQNAYLVELRQGGQIILTQSIGIYLPTTDWGTMGLFAGILLFIAISCIGIGNPRYLCFTVPLAFTIVHGLGLIRLGAPGTFNTAAVGGLWCVGILLWSVMRE